MHILLRMPEMPEMHIGFQTASINEFDKASVMMSV